MKYEKLNWPLMYNNITREDRDALIQYLKEDDNGLTNGLKVLEFEEAWSKWLGVRHSVFVNSGASANLLTMAYLRFSGEEEDDKIHVPTLTWVSDISSVLQNGFKPIFHDCDKHSLAMDMKRDDVLGSRAIFLTHVLGLCASDSTAFSQYRGKLIEDCCEAHGATWPDGAKVGTRGWISNFSFYYAHHMSTIEGGMISTNDNHVYEVVRMLRSHGMVREMRNEKAKRELQDQFPDVHPNFLFMLPAYNCRNTELGAVLGLSQLKRLNQSIQARLSNWCRWMNMLGGRLFETNFNHEGASPYGLLLMLKEPNIKLRDKIERLLTLCGVEFRRGLSGGGNQLRQPYLKGLKINPKDYPNVEHVTDFSWYVGNYPELEERKIEKLTKLLNQF